MIAFRRAVESPAARRKRYLEETGRREFVPRNGLYLIVRSQKQGATQWNWHNEKHPAVAQAPL